MPAHRFPLLCIAGLLGVLLAARVAPAAPSENYDPWPGLVQDIFNDRPMNDGSDVMAIEMPYRAEDAAIVPVTLRTKLSPGDSRRVRTITLVIDQNPAPMAAKFELGPDAGVSEISTRVRVNNYTNVHAVAELSDGKLYMVKTYVKASGGCSAPAAKNAEEANNRLGQMRYRQFAKSGARSDEGPSSGIREAQVMIGHPNNSGLQMDQVTQLYIPPFFVNQVKLWQDDSPVSGRGRRNLDFGRPQHPVHLYFERRETLPGRGQGYRRSRLRARMDGRRFGHVRRLGSSRLQKHLTSASAWARRRSFRALAACSEVRNCPPRLPRTCDMLSTVSAVTYRS